jgi:hypothetical protein
MRSGYVNLYYPKEKLPWAGITYTVQHHTSAKEDDNKKLPVTENRVDNL